MVSEKILDRVQANPVTMSMLKSQLILFDHFIYHSFDPDSSFVCELMANALKKVADVEFMRAMF